MRISGVGCSLVDYLYNHVDFTGEAFGRFRSRCEGDGGLTPGQLVFGADFAAFAGQPLADALREIVQDRLPDEKNVGGPAVVALLLAAQLLYREEVQTRFFGQMGQDASADYLEETLRQTPLDISGYRRVAGDTPSTVVLSDPQYDHGQGERVFINDLGVAGEYGVENIPADFYDSDIALVGATALVPRLHDGICSIVQRAREQDCLTVVTTVFDFRSERANPGGRWPLGESDATYSATDLLVVDLEEGLRMSGQARPEESLCWFREKGVGACIVTNGSHAIRGYADGSVFAQCDHLYLPVSEEVGRRLQATERPEGDTTGCGDNFVGGILASMAAELEDGERGALSLPEAVAAGVCCGGAACFQLGGVQVEAVPGEKRQAIEALYSAYRRQVEEQVELPESLFGKRMGS